MVGVMFERPGVGVGSALTTAVTIPVPPAAGNV